MHVCFEIAVFELALPYVDAKVLLDKYLL